MADWKVTFLFNGPSVGWSETLYRQSSGITEMRTAAHLLAALRAALLSSGQDQQIVAARISRLDTPFDSYLEPLGIDGLAQAGGGRPDFPWIGALVHCRAADGSASSPILRGIPDAGTEGPFDAVPENAGIRAAFIAWRNEVIGGSWCLRSIRKDVSVVHVIDDLTVSITGTLEVTSPSHGTAVGDRITWYRVKARGICLRGGAQVTGVVGNQFFLNGYDIAELTFLEGGFRVPVRHLSRIVTIEPGAARRKKTGRPIGLLRGRRSARTCR